MKLSYSQKILFLSIILFISVLFLDIIFSNLFLGKIANINNKNQQLELSIQERERELSLKDSIINSQIEREKLEQYFVGGGNAETVEFTKYLEELANKTNVTQKKTLDYESVSGLGSSEIVSAIRYKFNVSGKWNEVFNFLQEIENLPKAVYLNSVSFTANAEPVSIKESKTSGKIWSVDLDFSVAKFK